MVSLILIYFSRKQISDQTKPITLHDRDYTSAEWRANARLSRLLRWKNNDGRENFRQIGERLEPTEQAADR